MTDLPPGLAARRAKVSAAIVSTAPSPNPDQGLISGRQSSSRDASPRRSPVPVESSVDTSQWQLQDGKEYVAVWSVRLGKFISKTAQPLVYKKPMHFDLIQFYPRVLGFLQVKPENIGKIVEILELRNPRQSQAEDGEEQDNPPIYSVLDLSRNNLRSDPSWRHKKKKHSTNSDQGVDSDEHNIENESDAEEEDARREEDNLEQFAAKLGSNRADMKTEGKEWKLQLEIGDHPVKAGKKAISITNITVTLRPIDKKKEKKRQQALEWETRKLKKATAIPSSLFYRQVNEVAGKTRTRRSRFTEEERKFYLKLHDANSDDDESDVNEEPGDDMDEEDVE